jgi:spermidine/putrescine transport system ATP-binding protein
MNHGRFEQLGTPQELYYAPATAFVAGFVGASNRLCGKALAVDGAFVDLSTREGWVLRARRHGSIAAGADVEAYVRPEAAMLGRTPAELPPGQTAHRGEVTGVLFDGANSVVLLREPDTRLELRVALPQTGAFADLKVGSQVCFSFDAERAVCFAAASAHD